MCKFKPVILTPNFSHFQNLHYIPEIKKCYLKYFKFLQDDFAKTLTSDIYSFIAQSSPFFWVITDYEDRFMGFVYLDNFTGSSEKLYSAELTTCFDRKAWGVFTRYSAKFFLKKCFDELGLYKIKAQIYPDNLFVKRLLKSSGFEYETTLIKETLREGKPQDIDVFALYRTYYYKTR